MRTFIFIPPLRHMSGGLAVLYQVAEQLQSLGRPVRAAPRAEGAPGLESCSVPVCPWDELDLRTDDLWLVPEGWSNALAPGLQAGCRSVVYVQNWAYVFSSLPEGVNWRDLPVSFLAVSDPVALFLKTALGAETPVIRPALDLELFSTDKTLATDKGLRIAWMPRKNKACAQQIKAIVEARREIGVPLTWVEIDGKTPAQVAEILGSCHLFLATGFPEGLGLPPLEAMACGCLVAGFAGMGGWDYMRQAMLGGYLPHFALPRASFDPESSGNAFVAADYDTLSAALALETAAGIILKEPDHWACLRGKGRATASFYSKANQRQAVDALWRIWSGV